MKIELYQDASGEWRWRGVDGNSRIICDSAEGYITRGGCERALANVVGEFRNKIEVMQQDRRRAGYAQAQLVDRRRSGDAEPTFETLRVYEEGE